MTPRRKANHIPHACFSPAKSQGKNVDDNSAKLQWEPAHFEHIDAKIVSRAGRSGTNRTGNCGNPTLNLADRPQRQHCCPFATARQYLRVLA